MTRSFLLFLSITLLGACGDSSPTSSTSATEAENRDLATLRAATVGFQQYDVAKQAGYSFLFMNMCMEDTSPTRLGGMGYHYVNTALLDATVDVAHPEALLYELGSTGQLYLVAVEYVIPKTAWTAAQPPMLFGKQFKLNAFDLWALHVWVWDDNPSGLYADWSPRVSCINAAK